MQKGHESPRGTVNLETRVHKIPFFSHPRKFTVQQDRERKPDRLVFRAMGNRDEKHVVVGADWVALLILAADTANETRCQLSGRTS